MFAVFAARHLTQATSGNSAEVADAISGSQNATTAGRALLILAGILHTLAFQFNPVWLNNIACLKYLCVTFHFASLKLQVSDVIQMRELYESALNAMLLR